MTFRTRSRVILFCLLTLGILLVFLLRLYQIQIVEGEKIAAEAATYSYSTTVQAVRGEILDRNGVVLVGNQVSYNVTLNSYVLLRTNGLNDILLKLSDACRSAGIGYSDSFPISEGSPWTYTTDECTSTELYYFRSFLLYRDLDPDMQASNLMKHLRKSYSIPEDWSDEDVRRVIGLRYELELRYAVNIDSYVLASGLSSSDLMSLKELNIPGLIVETSTTRVYNTGRAAHVLGHVSMMTAEDYEVLQDQGYAMNARIGKEGAEEAFESWLRGTDGKKITTITTDGQIVDEYYETEPVAGGNVYLTIDIGLQALAEDTLESTILEMRSKDTSSASDAVGDGTDAEGGAIVVMKTDTGEVLASASYPTYDIRTYNTDFNELLEAEDSPLYNRVLLAAYPPGSTYKMVTALAALKKGVITPYTEIDDTGVYTRFDDFQPTCLAYKRSGVGHGLIDLADAISVSCNYFFYEAGWLTGMEAIDSCAEALGLGESTGVELPENIGHRANPETKSELYNLDWYDADTLTASIGQSDNAFTPMQLACYVSALANRGVRYKATYLSRVMSSSYDSVLYESEPEVLSTLLASDSDWDAVASGMEQAVSSGTAKGLADYEISVAAKTGTASHGSEGSDNAAFVCYAPADDPEIAIVIYVEKGAAGSTLAAVAEPLLDYIFDSEGDVEYVTLELDSMPASAED